VFEKSEGWILDNVTLMYVCKPNIGFNISSICGAQSSYHELFLILQKPHEPEENMSVAARLEAAKRRLHERYEQEKSGKSHFRNPKFPVLTIGFFFGQLLDDVKETLKFS